jgi:hypothetical protein
MPSLHGGKAKGRRKIDTQMPLVAVTSLLRAKFGDTGHCGPPDLLKRPKKTAGRPASSKTIDLRGEPLNRMPGRTAIDMQPLVSWTCASLRGKS